MKSYKDTVGNRVEGKVEVIGTFDFYECETVEEAVGKFGEAATLALINRSYASAQQALAREACKKEGEGKKTPEEIQALIDGYKPGASVTRFSLKNYLALFEATVAAEKYEVAKMASALYRENAEEAFNYLLENQG